MPLTNRIILVTGASSGIGLAVARAMIEAGATVLPTGRRRSGALPNYCKADLSAPEGRSDLVHSLEESIDRLDVVIHNAGALGTPATPLASYDETQWRLVQEVNVTAVQLLHQGVQELLAASDRPTVIVVSSSVGRRGRAGWGAYAVSKHALEGWADVLADEWGEVGRVYSVNPGATATPMRALAAPDEDQTAIPAPSDITPVFLHLAHDHCSVPSGSKLDARSWIGRDPWIASESVGRVALNDTGEIQ